MTIPPLSRLQEPASSGDVTLKALWNEYADPHALYDVLRRRDPVAFDPASQCWLVTDHAAARRILADERFTPEMQARPAAPARSPARRSFIEESIQRQIIFHSGETQRRAHRAILQQGARAAEALEPEFRAEAWRLARAARAAGGLDLVRDFAVPFSVQVIARVVGVPTADAEVLARLEGWSTTYANVTSGHLAGDMRDIVLLGEYFRALVASRGGDPGDDLLGAFIREGVFADPEDLVINCMMTFAAGRITTQKLLGNGVPLLLESSAWERERLRGPGAGARLADELLRVVTPTRYLARYAGEDVDLSPELPGEHRIRRGQKVILFLEAANRDPERFACPHALDPDRQPNPHLAFGFGPHRCPGAALARREILVALEVLMEAFPHLRPHPSLAPSWDPNPNLGGYASYPCLLE